MKSKLSLQILLATIAVFLISSTSTPAQNLHLDWTTPGSGGVGIRSLKNMTVLENGERYVIEEQASSFIVAKYNDAGELMRQTAAIDGGEASIAYNAGTVFVFFTSSSAAITLAKFTSDLSYLNEASIGGGIARNAKAMVADPVGRGVIVTGLLRYSDAGPWGERHYRMITIKYDLDLSDVWIVEQHLGLLGGGPPPTSPRTIAADSEGNTYVTGVSHVEVLPAMSPARTCESRAFTLKYNRDGILQGPPLESAAPSITNFGYDNDYDATGIYMVHQRAPVHLSDAPLLTGETVLTKRNLDGSTWTRPRPSRIRDFFNWPPSGKQTVDREVLAVDKITSSVYIAYDEASSASSVALEKYNTDGDMLWDRHISIGESTIVRSVIIDRSGNVVVGVNNEVRGTYSIFAYDAEGRFKGRGPEIAGKVLKQLMVDNDNHIHAVGLISGSTTSYFVSRFTYEITSRFSSAPELLMPIEGLDFDLFAFDPGECWTGPFINWNCLRPPFCFSPKEMKASLLLQDKTVWETTFVKPIDTTFPESKDFRSFSLKVNDGQMFQEVLLVDDKLVKNGVTQLSLKTNSIDGSVDLNIKTNGAQIPVTISLRNAQGKALWKEQFTAPFQKQISERFNEPVASVSINGPEDKISLTYYPNPSNGVFTVILDQVNFPAELSIYDMQGFRIHQQMVKESKVPIDLSNYKPGLYVLSLKNGSDEIKELIQIK